jgi:hypothetical protein
MHIPFALLLAVFFDPAPASSRETPTFCPSDADNGRRLTYAEFRCAPEPVE